jgi:hypothetical protein
VSHTTVGTLMGAQSRPRFLLVTFAWSAPKQTDQLRPVFDVAIDWIRYMPSCWIIYTTTRTSWWYERIRHYMVQDDRVFICELNLKESAGWLDTWVWDWINKAR